MAFFVSDASGGLPLDEALRVSQPNPSLLEEAQAG